MHSSSHLDYCDSIYHIPASNSKYTHDIYVTDAMSSLESLQYQSALAVTGAWKGTNRDKIYEQLGWETLHNRRESRRLTQFYKIMNNLTPSYLKTPVPEPQTHLFGPRSTNVIPNLSCRNDRFKNSFYPHAIELWNAIGVEFRSIEKLSDFKSSLLEIIRPLKKDIFDILNPDGTKQIFQLRVGLSPLRAHKFNHNFIDTSNNICLCGNGTEDTEHFLLVCPFFANIRKSLVENVSKLVNFQDLSTNDKINCLLYGSQGLLDSQNAQILSETINFIFETKRFEQETTD